MLAFAKNIVRTRDYPMKPILWLRVNMAFGSQWNADDNADAKFTDNGWI
jgi:hypothetical protein